jgi:AcrR family transcriptional regulator
MKAEERRAAIIDRLADHILSHGLAASSLRALGKAAGTSDRMLLYYFSDKAELIAAAMENIAARVVALMEAQGPPVPRSADALWQDVSMMILSDDLWPFMRVWLETATLSAQGDAMTRSIGGAIGRGFLAWTEGQIDEPDAAVRLQKASRLLAMAEGLVLLKALGLDDICEQAAK